MGAYAFCIDSLIFFIYLAYFGGFIRQRGIRRPKYDFEKAVVSETNIEVNTYCTQDEEIKL